MIVDAPAGHTRVPATVRQILKDALALRDARDSGGVDPQALAGQVLRLGERLDALLAAGDPACCEPCRKLVKHLRNERDALLKFLAVPRVQATN